MKNIRIFYLKIFLFLVVKFSLYLNRHVFVMVLKKWYSSKYKYRYKISIRMSSPYLTDCMGLQQNINEQ